MASALPGLVPKLRFPKYQSEELLRVQLGDVTEEGRERNEQTHTAASVMGVSKAEGIVPMEARLIAPDIARYKIVEHDWFAYNPMRLNIGSIARWKGGREILVSPDYVVFKCIADEGAGLLPSYFDQFRQSKAWEDFVTEGGDGGVRVRIYYNDIARLQLALPSLPEQQQIAECLSTLDELMAAESQKLDALKAHKKGLMQQLFPREGETLPRLRFPEFQDAPEWEKREVGEIFTVTRGQVLAMPRVSETMSDAAPYPVYSSQTKHSGLCGFYSDFLFEDAITWTTDGANAGDVNFRTGKFYCTNVCGVLLSSEGYANPCIAALINSVARSHVSYIGNPKLMNGVMAKIVIPFPSVAEQHRIATCLSSLDDLIAAQSDQLEALQTHKQGLMQQLFPSPVAAEA
jgi:type I restriction enzyme, S subunit